MLDAVFSFVIDNEPRFVRSGFHLVKSLLRHTEGLDLRVFVQVTPEVNEETRAIFRGLGCDVRQIDRFGDGRYCNKLNQFEAFTDVDFRYAVLMDTDMVVLAPLQRLLTGDRIRGRVVAHAVPSVAALERLADMSGLPFRPPVTATDCSGLPTLEGNLNGGLYVVPAPLTGVVSVEWKRWTEWVRRNDEPLRSEGRQDNADQVGLWLALHHAALPWEALAANWNYNPANNHLSFDASAPVAMLHYHRRLDHTGRISIDNPPAINVDLIKRANAELEAHAYVG